MPSELSLAIKQIAEEKNIPAESVVEAIESALASAYNKDYGDKKTHNIKVKFDVDTMDMDVVDEKTVVGDALVETYEKELAEAAQRKQEEETKPLPPIEESELTAANESEQGAEGEEEIRFNPKTMIGLTAAKQMKEDANVGEVLRIPMEKPEGFGRMAAQTAKQVIIQRLREAERTVILTNFQGRVGEVINGMVQRVEGRTVYIDLGQAVGILSYPEQIRNERYRLGARLKVYIKNVLDGSKGPEIVLSRTAPELVAELFAHEVPEVNSGAVEIKAIAREAGSRTKIAVTTEDDHIDPVGSCVGQRGTRVQTVIQELGGEKIDIIEFSEDTKKFISHSLSPAKVVDVELNEDTKTAKVMVSQDQLSLAIGRNGQNVRLASQLTGYNIDIVEAETGEGQKAEEEKSQTGSGNSEQLETPAESPAEESVTDDTAEVNKSEAQTNQES